MRTLLLAALVFALAGCDSGPIVTTTQAPNGLRVQFYGVVDGCKVYELPDLNDAVVVHCPQGTASATTTYHRMIGKVVYTYHTRSETN